MAKDESEMKLEVLPNNCTAKEPCSICGILNNSGAPYWIFLNGDLCKPVCDGCAEKHAPNLLAVVNSANEKFWGDLELKKKKEKEARQELLEHYISNPPPTLSGMMHLWTLRCMTVL